MMVQGITCNEVTTYMSPCLSYLTNGGEVSDACCGGVRTILGAAGTTSEKQTVCNCLKEDANNFGINDDYAQALPTRCGVSVPYKISRSTNCEKYHQVLKGLLRRVCTFVVGSTISIVGMLQRLTSLYRWKLEFPASPLLKLERSAPP
ncbi:Non-specific lipid-transfer protein [Vigna angularis]|uniref:Non-specific lipid-transfer protein n=1 Tax=Phaseolus angularis TaxID=3914 RepID=A0A8T0KZ92_PHAAN|nr:Non-specific lipid-transfer protein [Vigna angularis]